LKDWERAADVLRAFRSNYPKHELQGDVTKKIAYVYKEAGKLSLAAAEYERIEKETKDDEIRRSALLVAADLWEQAEDPEHALQVYKRYIGFFPKPLELALETRNKIAGIYKARGDKVLYLGELKQIVAEDARAGAERTDRTRFLAATSALALAEPLYEAFAEIKLVKPFNKNLAKKKTAMKTALDAFGKLTKFEVGEVTAATTYYLAEIYFNFSQSLMASERPTELSSLELEQYEEALEEQAFPFEEKAIKVHEKNLELLSLGIYNAWIDKTFVKLATLVPARYAKYEESSGYLTSIDSFSYQFAEAQLAAKPEGDVQEAAPVNAEVPARASGESRDAGSGSEPAQADVPEAPVAPAPAG
jgi:tetratricopeptide (TPR) repeat protein